MVRGPYSAEDLASLPEVERQVLVLSAVEGQSMRGAARRVGVPEMAPYKLYQQARQRLEGRVRSLEGSELLALRRLVEALHAAAGPEGRLPSRTWAMAAAGLKQLEHNQLIGRLEAAGGDRGAGAAPARPPGGRRAGGDARSAGDWVATWRRAVEEFIAVHNSRLAARVLREASN